MIGITILRPTKAEIAKMRLINRVLSEVPIDDRKALYEIMERNKAAFTPLLVEAFGPIAAE